MTISIENSLVTEHKVKCIKVNNVIEVYLNE